MARPKQTGNSKPELTEAEWVIMKVVYGFARGALRAAHWLIGKKPGLYSMADCLGLSNAKKELL